jgi:phosphoglycolate phosphatase/pyrophosphatase PpaX
MKYRCLVLDHDDTAVDSTATVHYPAHVEVMRRMRPKEKPVSLEQWFCKNFDPGILEFLVQELRFTEEELDEEYRIWKQYAEDRIPDFYPGIVDALRAYRRRGGKIVVVSHSIEEIIYRDYQSAGFQPDLIYGWNFDETKRKPHPWPVLDAMERTRTEAGRLLVIDDLRPGVLMARAAGLEIAAAGWAHRIPKIEAYMRDNCKAYFRTVEEFSDFILK